MTIEEYISFCPCKTYCRDKEDHGLVHMHRCEKYDPEMEIQVFQAARRSRLFELQKRNKE